MFGLSLLKTLYTPFLSSWNYWCAKIQLFIFLPAACGMVIGWVIFIRSKINVVLVLKIILFHGTIGLFLKPLQKVWKNLNLVSIIFDYLLVPRKKHCIVHRQKILFLQLEPLKISVHGSYSVTRGQILKVGVPKGPKYFRSMTEGELNDRNDIFLPMYYALFFLGTSK